MEVGRAANEFIFCLNTEVKNVGADSEADQCSEQTKAYKHSRYNACIVNMPDARLGDNSSDSQDSPNANACKD
jgi:hypothetical protein